MRASPFTNGDDERELEASANTELSLGASMGRGLGKGEVAAESKRAAGGEPGFFALGGGESAPESIDEFEELERDRD